MSEKNNKELNKYRLILDHCLMDLKEQNERKVNVDTKTSYVLIILVFLLGIILQGDIAKTIIGENFCENTVFQIIIRSYMFLFLVIDIILCLISSIFFVNVLINKKYTKINSKLWDTSVLKDVNEIDIVKGLIENYTRAMENNTKINDKVMKAYKNGIIFLIISIFLTILICIVIIFL